MIFFPEADIGKTEYIGIA